MSDWSRQVNTDIKTLARNIENMGSGLKKIDDVQRAAAARQQREAHVAAVVQLAERENSHSHSYANVVIGLGYAGFYGLWNLVEKFPYPGVRAFAGLSVAISLVVFVAWEVFKMTYCALKYQAVNKALAASNQSQAADAWERATTKINDAVNCLWLWQLVPAVLFAALGAGALLYIFAAEMIRVLAS